MSRCCRACVSPHEIQRVGRVAQVSQQFVARNAGEPFPPALVEAILEAAVGQLRDDQQPAVDHFDPFQRQQKRMPHAATRPAPAVRSSPLLVVLAEDELDGLGQPAGASARHTSP